MRFPRVWFVVLFLACGVGRIAAVTAAAPKIDYYHPRYRVPPTLESVLRHLEPGHDAFPEEKTAEELGGRLKQLGALLRQGPAGGAAIAGLLAPDFRGGRLTPADEVAVGDSPQLEIFRARVLPRYAVDRLVDDIDRLYRALLSGSRRTT